MTKHDRILSFRLSYNELVISSTACVVECLDPEANPDAEVLLTTFFQKYAFLGTFKSKFLLKNAF